MVELENVAARVDAAAQRPARRGAAAQRTGRQPAGFNRATQKSLVTPRATLPSRAQRALRSRRRRTGPSRRSATRPTGPADDRAPQGLPVQTLTIRAVPSRSTIAPPGRARTRRCSCYSTGAQGRPATPASRACSTTPTTRPVRSTSTTASGTSCTSRSTTSSLGPCGDRTTPSRASRRSRAGRWPHAPTCSSRRGVRWRPRSQPAGHHTGPVRGSTCGIAPDDPALRPDGSTDTTICDTAWSRRAPTNATRPRRGHG